PALELRGRRAHLAAFDREILDDLLARFTALELGGIGHGVLLDDLEISNRAVQFIADLGLVDSNLPDQDRTGATQRARVEAHAHRADRDGFRAGIAAGIADGETGDRAFTRTQR